MLRFLTVLSLLAVSSHAAAGDPGYLYVAHDLRLHKRGHDLTTLAVVKNGQWIAADKAAKCRATRVGARIDRVPRGRITLATKPFSNVANVCVAHLSKQWRGDFIGLGRLSVDPIKRIDLKSRHASAVLTAAEARVRAKVGGRAARGFRWRRALYVAGLKQRKIAAVVISLSPKRRCKSKLCRSGIDCAANGVRHSAVLVYELGANGPTRVFERIDVTTDADQHRGIAKMVDFVSVKGVATPALVLTNDRCECVDFDLIVGADKPGQPWRAVVSNGSGSCTI